MNRRRMMWGAQLTTVALCALALKQYYSTATANELRWILAPTTLLVELLSGRSFEFESYTGYMSSDHRFVIAVPCAGVNFLIMAFVMLAVRQLWRGRFESVSWRFLPISMAASYVATVIANAVRICVALEIQRNSFEVSWLTANQLHRVEGIVVYFGFLMLLFVVIERRLVMFPVIIYYVMTLGVPLLNGSFHRAAFWEHFGFVIVVPLVMLLPIKEFSRKKAQKAQKNKRGAKIPFCAFCAFLRLTKHIDAPCGRRSRRTLRYFSARSCDAG